MRAWFARIPDTLLRVNFSLLLTKEDTNNTNVDKNIVSKSHEQTPLLFISITWVSVNFSTHSINKCFCGDQAGLRDVSGASASASTCGWGKDY